MNATETFEPTILKSFESLESFDPATAPLILTVPVAKPSVLVRRPERGNSLPDLIDRLQAGLENAIVLASSLPEPKRTRRMKQLELGRVRNSKVMGCATVEKVKELLQAIANGDPLLATHTRPNGFTAYCFRVPKGWKAFGRCIRAVDLARSRSDDWIKRNVEMVVVHQPDRSIKIMHQAPFEAAHQTKVLTFIYDDEDQILADWWAGEDVNHLPVMSAEGCWVHCGVDLCSEPV